MNPAPRAGAVPGPAYSNEDLAPTSPAQRTWALGHFAALWIGLSVCIPTYMLAASLIGAGMNWWQSLLTILLGNAIVFVAIAINSHAGARYGIPFPVYARASFGLLGAHLPALLRSVVACGWFGIQTWIGGLALSEILGIIWPAWRTLGGNGTIMGLGVTAFLGFGMFWLMNLWFVWKGTESIKWLETFSAPFLLLIGLVLLWWATSAAGGLGGVLHQTQALRPAGSREGFWGTLFLPWLTAMVGFWATLSISIPDFTRFARSQRDQLWGQGLGLLITMPLFAFIGIAVTGATMIRYGTPIWNPVELVGRLAGETGSVILPVVALLAILIATLTTNLAANIVAPANSFSNLSPRRVSARTGGLIAAAIGILILPWKLLDAYQTWLISYSGLLGAVGGVIMCDYAVIRRGRLSLAVLYGEGSSGRQVNSRAMIATAAGVLVPLAGLLVPGASVLFHGAWFTGTLTSSLVYYLLMRPPRGAAPSGGTHADI